MAATEDTDELVEQLQEIEQVLALDPDNEELLSLKKELEGLIGQTYSNASSASAAQKTDSSPKRPAPAQQPVSRKVGDVVLAKWITGDHQYYQAKITSITGSLEKPIFAVRFVDYNEVQTLQAHQLKDADAFSQMPAAHTKRKPPQPPAPPGQAIPAPDGVAEPAKKKPTKVAQELESSKSTWQNFAQAGPKRKSATLTSTSALNKVKKGSSMFRTSEEGRVGVMTGPQVSQMTASNVRRGRHVFEREESEEVDRFERGLRRRSRSRSRSRSPAYSARHGRHSRSRSRERGYRDDYRHRR